MIETRSGHNLLMHGAKVCANILDLGLGDSIVSKQPPILARKDFAAPSVFEPRNLLREARRQKNLPNTAVPDVCILDPDGDIVRALAKAGRTRRSPGWAHSCPAFVSKRLR